MSLEVNNTDIPKREYRSLASVCLSPHVKQNTKQCLQDHFGPPQAMNLQELMAQAGLDDAEQNRLREYIQFEKLEDFFDRLCDTIEIIPEEQEVEYA